MTLTNKKAIRAAFFDLDFTILEVDSFRFFLKKFYIADPTHFFHLPRIFFYGMARKLRLIPLKKFKEQALVGLKGLTYQQIEQIGEDFFDRYLTHKIRSSAVEKINLHKKNGDLIFIISASPDIYVHSVSLFLGCDGYICSFLEYGQGVFNGRFLGEDCLGKEKIKRIHELSLTHQIDLKKSYAYSDHESDLSLLAGVGNATAVNPTKKLKNEALLRHWSIEEWM